jgi:hypothetical protein
MGRFPTSNSPRCRFQHHNEPQHHQLTLQTAQAIVSSADVFEQALKEKPCNAIARSMLESKPRNGATCMTAIKRFRPGDLPRAARGNHYLHAGRAWLVGRSERCSRSLPWNHFHSNYPRNCFGCAHEACSVSIRCLEPRSFFRGGCGRNHENGKSRT